MTAQRDHTETQLTTKTSHPAPSVMRTHDTRNPLRQWRSRDLALSPTARRGGLPSAVPGTRRRVTDPGPDGPDRGGQVMPDRHHGVEPPRGMWNTPKERSYAGRFGRMFQGLAETPAHDPTNPAHDDELRAIALSMREAAGPGVDNPDIPAGYVYLGQFVDHDLTFDPTSQLQRRNDPDGLLSFRTPPLRPRQRLRQRPRRRTVPVPARRGARRLRIPHRAHLRPSPERRETGADRGLSQRRERHRQPAPCRVSAAAQPADGRPPQQPHPSR